MAITAVSCVLAAETNQPLTIAEQGAFAVGGTVVANPGTFDYKTLASAGQTLHGDHASVFYQIPVDAKKFPIAFLHGAGQSSRTWQTTPDGREGFQNIFLRRGYSVYLIDQPRRGQAGLSSIPGSISAAPSDQLFYSFFRIGNWPDYYPGVQFPKDAASLEQYFRQSTPNTGPYDQDVVSDAVAALFEKIGPGVLVTHSQGGGPGWLAAIKSANVRAIVAYEPGSSFVFPKGELPPPMPSLTGTLEGFAVPLDDFMKLTRVPIVVYYGDNIPEQTDVPGQDNWRVRLLMARLWVEAINKRGGDAALVHLPSIGVYGNTHFPFSDLNSVEIADLMEKFLEEKGMK
ncbi:MAG: alpha/beta fold hydrolase [Deltaproteobacteria bacterium]|nr:alpha/beta fold hydrolase [Deltaproteobacteria bacterium]